MTEMTAERLSVERLRRDLRASAAELSAFGARQLVDAYYTIQGYRIEADNNALALKKDEEPHEFVEWLGGQQGILEAEIQKVLSDYSLRSDAGRWLRSLTGIGPVIAAGLLAHIDIHRARTAGQIWRFAGLDPTVTWERGQKRPWNGRLKVLAWKAGESFTKQSGRPCLPGKAEQEGVQTRCVEGCMNYGHVYLSRKRRETDKNLNGDFADQAAASLAGKRFGKDTDAIIWYSGRLTRDAAERVLAAETAKKAALMRELAGEDGSGVPMLPPGRIHLRSQRYAVKLFLAHFHHVLYESELDGAPPFPYILENPQADPTGAPHSRYLAPPNWPLG